MNIELDEVVQDVSDEALELAAGGAQGGGQCAGAGLLALATATPSAFTGCW